MKTTEQIIAETPWAEPTRQTLQGDDDMRHAHLDAIGYTTWHDHDVEGTHNPAVGLDAATEAFNAYLEYERRHSLLDIDAKHKFNDLTHDYWSRRLDKVVGVDYNGVDQIDEDEGDN